MPKLAEQLEAAKAEVQRLERIAAAATCAELGHDWQSVGGCNCGCHDEADCSVPVHQCTRCQDYDYGQNDEAGRIRAECKLRVAS